MEPGNSERREGRLGWLDTPLPVALVAAYLALLLALTVLDTEARVEVTARQRALYAAVTIACLVLVSASQYVSFTAYGAASIDGLQGRHFIPAALAGAWALRGRWLADRVPARARSSATVALVALGFAAAVRALLERFYGN